MASKSKSETKVASAPKKTVAERFAEKLEMAKRTLDSNLPEINGAIGGRTAYARGVTLASLRGSPDAPAPTVGVSGAVPSLQSAE